MYIILQNVLQAFVAWGKSPDDAGGDIIFIAEFGDGDIIRRPNFLKKENFLKWDGMKSEVVFSGEVALDVK